MFRYIYFLSFLLSLGSTFSYDYIEEPERSVRKNEGYVNGRTLKKGRDRRNLIRQEYDYDRSPVEFDVASFIQADDELADGDEGAGYEEEKRRHFTNNDDYGALVDIDTDNKKREKTSDYSNIGDNPPELNVNSPVFKEAVNTRHSNYNNPLDDMGGIKLTGSNANEKLKNLYKNDMSNLAADANSHSAEKKCALRKLKFPFFSRKKPEGVPKKEKKRKLFSFTSSKKEAQKKVTNENKNQDPLTQFKIKRSYAEKLCPLCKKKFIANSTLSKRRKKNPKKMMHNTREFYENLPDEQIQEDMMTARKQDVEEMAYSRKKREDYRDRQLKELEEVQKKIDEIEINMPVYSTPADVQTT